MYAEWRGQVLPRTLALLPVFNILAREREREDELEREDEREIAARSLYLEAPRS